MDSAEGGWARPPRTGQGRRSIWPTPMMRAPDARIPTAHRAGTARLPAGGGADKGGALPPGRDPRPRSRRPQEPRLLLLASEGLHVRAAAPLGPALQVEDPDGAGDDARQPRSS